MSPGLTRTLLVLTFVTGIVVAGGGLAALLARGSTVRPGHGLGAALATEVSLLAGAAAIAAAITLVAGLGHLRTRPATT